MSCGGTAVGYRRVSTIDQADSGLGLEAQQSAITVAATRLKITVRLWCTDAGISGSLGLEHRQGLADALNALRRGDILMVAKRDRIARDTFLSVLVEREVSRKGARIVSAAGEGTETDEPAAIFTRRILDAVSELERALISSRTRAAMAEAKKRGQRVGGIPFGMRLDVSGHSLVPHQQERAVLDEIRRLRSRGYALVSIANELNGRGWRNRQGREWKASFAVSSWIAIHD